MIKQLHEKLMRREISATELTQEYLARIKKSDLNALISVTETAVLMVARDIDQRIKKDETIPLLAGLPATIKDTLMTKNMRTTAGSKILDNYIAPYDATVISKLKEQGIVILGKNNCDEFALGGSNENSAYGPVKNPHDKKLVTGGTSGGSAAAVAADLSVYSIGSDTGGSIRQPAAFCGVVGLKPTYGAVSRSGLIAMTSSFDQIGPLAKSVEDCRIVFEVIKGKDSLDATSIEIKGNRKEIKGNNLEGIKIGVPKEYFNHEFDAEIKSAVEAAIKQAEKLGAEIVKVSLPHTEYALATYYIIMFAEASSNLARFDGMRYGQSTNDKNLIDVYLKSRGKFLGEEVKRRILLGTYVLSAGYYEAYYKKAQQVRTLIRQDFEKVFSKVDMLMTPVTPTLPWKIGAKKDDPLSMYLEDVFTVPVNIAGVPALSLPCGQAKNGLPIGVQLISGWGSEDLLLGVGEILEKK